MTNATNLMLILLTIFISTPSFAQKDEQGYYDFKSKKMVSKEEFENEQSRLTECSNEASNRVQEKIADGTIPLTSDASENADWQRAFHSEYVRRCLDKK